MSQQTFTMNARTGRNNQRYGVNGERLVAGIVPLSANKSYVLLIQSSSHKKWVLPKGGWETDEATAQDAACREAWEEAGIHCKVTQDLGSIDEKRSCPQFTDETPRVSYRFFEATVERMEKQWPEAQKRSRKWCTHAKAAEALKDRPELLTALNRSSMHREPQGECPPAFLS